jgi:large subunit ribosomal protein L5
MAARLQEFYRTTVVPKLKSELNLSNVMEVPRITKITVNMGVGEAVADRKVIDNAAGDMAKITGQKPLICKAKKAIATFKVREGLPIGVKVTLRGARMYLSARLRWSRQLQHGRARADHFPRDSVRPDRCHSRHGHHDYHHGSRQQARAGTAGRL